jgi:hypothetical protein
VHSGVIERVTSGWLDLTAALPESAVLPDLRGLELNARLRGSSRVARGFGSPQPYLRADACVDRLVSRAEWTALACEDFRAVAQIAAGREGALPIVLTSALPIADVERACAETGWHTAVADGSGLRVDIPTRHGTTVARLESSSNAGLHFVIDLVDVAGRPDVCRRAAAALLLAVSGSVRLVKGAIVERGAGHITTLMSPLVTAREAEIDDALSALSVACEGTVREVEALMDERLASEYLALSCGASGEAAPASMEEDLCLQQP